MKHLNKLRKFGRVKKQREALIKHLAHSLILYEKIETSEAKAKSLRPVIEKLITKSKTETLASRRYLASRLSVQSAKKIFKELGPKYKTRMGGYTRIIKTPPRKSDGAKMAIIEFV
jgi:large subunit ribosomal protein L17